jgi:FtsP/CotA-like multicopper oxidase with cupredoxin domain
VPLVYERTLESLRPVTVWPPELSRGRARRYLDLVSANGVVSPALGANQIIPITLGSAMMGGYVWTINGQAYPNANPIGLDRGARVRLRVTNATMMRHPLHLHGHFFTSRLPGAAGGPTKDTVLVDPMATLDLEFLTDNPGRWFFHCHHLYHMEAGMARILEYR